MKARYTTLLLALAVTICMAGCCFDENDPPVAAFSATPSEGDSPLAVRLDATASSDSDGQIVSFEWNFKDGTGNVYGSVVDHQFATAEDRTFQVTLTVRDNDGDESTCSHSVYVHGDADGPPAPPGG